MWREIEPDERHEIPVEGGNVVAYVFGTGDETVLCLNGGPGLPCDYLREGHSWLVDEGYRVIAFDQLGTGQASRPDDESLWRIDRYVAETEIVRRALVDGPVHLLGHSWGGWLAIDYVLTHPDAVRSLILADTSADMPHLVSELNRLKAALGSETVAMMQRHEALGTFEHPEYVAALTLLNYRHVCRLDEWPAPIGRSLDDWNMGPYVAMQGPNEFLFTGNLTHWNRVPDLHRVEAPTLVVCGQHDELTPACSMRIHQNVPGAEIEVFPNSSHMPFYEEPEPYARTLRDFLSRHRVAG